MSTEANIIELQNQVGDLINTINGKFNEWDSKVNEARNQINNFIANARGEYIKFSYFKELDTKLVLAPTNQYQTMLSVDQVNSDIFEIVKDNLGFADKYKLKNPYQYSTANDYSPVDENGNNCFADLYIHNIPKISGYKYLVLVVNVEGHNDKTQVTTVDVVEYEMGSHTFWRYPNHYDHPFLNIHGARVFGKNWGDNYKDTNIIRFDDDYWYYGSKKLRVINRGNRTLEIFGYGIIVK